MIPSCKSPVGLLGGIVKTPEKPNLYDFVQTMRVMRAHAHKARDAFEQCRGRDREKLAKRWGILDDEFDKISARGSWLGIRWDADIGDNGEYFIPDEVQQKFDELPPNPQGCWADLEWDIHSSTFYFKTPKGRPKEGSGKPQGFPGHSFMR